MTASAIPTANEHEYLLRQQQDSPTKFVTTNLL
jgi:hypothetical protein